MDMTTKKDNTLGYGLRGLEDWTNSQQATMDHFRGQIFSPSGAAEYSMELDILSQRQERYPEISE